MDGMEFIKIDERAYQYIRQFSVKGINDAMVELITNSVDAYNKNPSNDDIKIDIIRKHPDIVIVRDYAIGMDATTMKQCFLQVGKYTNEPGCRGFFSRGAKDISAIADITFTAIKDGKISQCFLNSKAMGKMTIQDEDVTDELRLMYCIKNNGLEVSMKLLPNFNTINIQTLHFDISNLVLLRHIVNKFAVTISEINKDGAVTFESDVHYVYPEGKKILDLDFVVPNYPDKVAHFEIFLASQPVPKEKNVSMMNFGFLVADSSSVYEPTLFDGRFAGYAMIRYLYGTLHCDGIGELLIELDSKGPTPLNPTPIIDPSRVSGTNKSHPFIKNLYRIPAAKIEQILREMHSAENNRCITNEDINDILNELKKLGINLLDDEGVTFNYVNSNSSNNLRSIDSFKDNIISERKYLYTNDDKIAEEMRKFLTEELLRMKIEDEMDRYFYVEDKAVASVLKIDVKSVENIDRKIIFEFDNNKNLIRVFLSRLGSRQSIKMSKDSNLLQSKKLSLSFINDKNLRDRYFISTTDGIQILFNTNNPLIGKYLDAKKISSDKVSIKEFSTDKCLVFFRDILIDALSDAIYTVNSNAGKIPISGDASHDLKVMQDYKNEMARKIECPIDAIFDRIMKEKLADRYSMAKAYISDVNVDKDTLNYMLQG